MPLVIRKGIDLSAGHCFVPTAAVEGSPDVFVGNEPVVRVGDLYPSHCCPGSGCHDMGPAAEGSSTVLVNGQPVHRNGDAITCGDVAANGMPTVNVGD